VVAGFGYGSLLGHDAKGSTTLINDTPAETFIAVGGTPVRGLVIGGQLGATAGNLTIGQLGLFVQWYPAPRGGWHVGFDVGPAITTAWINRGVAPVSSGPGAPSGVEYTSAWGYGAIATLQGGYDWWIAPRWSMGLDLFASGGTLEAMLDSKNNDTGYRLAPLQVGLGLNVAYQ
jgi:hypothetical protein